MSDLTTVSCATPSLVKCFGNSVLGVNLTTILIDMEPWFIAKEVATLLGYENTKQAILTNVDELDQRILSRSECEALFGQNIVDAETIENTDDLKGLSDRPLENTTNISNRGMKFINESGLYTLIARSNKPEARRFQRWVTSEVLPSIRKTGQYIIQKQTPSYAIEDPIERAKAWISEQEEKRALEDKTKALEVDKRQLEADNENLTEQRDKAIRERGYINDKRTATLMSQEGIRARKINKLENELSDTIEKLDQANVDNDILKAQLEIAKSSMLTNKRVCEMLRDRFEISWADSTLKSRTSKALQSIANEFGENIIYDKQFVDGVLRKVPYYTQRTADILMQRLAYDCAYLRQF